mmetsp:Transcript_25342/g.30994  ORF Transcript_25342/g.30994 Transcript_25342/m.30994 type:complete len:337 (+) Transcript_25342:1670-2680(+)
MAKRTSLFREEVFTAPPVKHILRVIGSLPIVPPAIPNSTFAAAVTEGLKHRLVLKDGHYVCRIANEERCFLCIQNAKAGKAIFSLDNRCNQFLGSSTIPQGLSTGMRFLTVAHSDECSSTRTETTVDLESASLNSRLCGFHEGLSMTRKTYLNIQHVKTAIKHLEQYQQVLQPKNVDLASKLRILLNIWFTSLYKFEIIIHQFPESKLKLLTVSQTWSKAEYTMKNYKAYCISTHNLEKYRLRQLQNKLWAHFKDVKALVGKISALGEIPESNKVDVAKGIRGFIDLYDGNKGSWSKGTSYPVRRESESVESFEIRKENYLRCKQEYTFRRSCWIF